MNPKPSLFCAETYGFGAGQALLTTAAAGQLPGSTPTMQLVGLIGSIVLPIAFGWLRTVLKRPPQPTVTEVSGLPPFYALPKPAAPAAVSTDTPTK
jgi:hypothetical protein